MSGRQTNVVDATSGTLTSLSKAVHPALEELVHSEARDCGTLSFAYAPPSTVLSLAGGTQFPIPGTKQGRKGGAVSRIPEMRSNGPPQACA